MVHPSCVLKRIAFTLSLLIATSLPVLAQQNWFIFIQAENNRPFYAKIGENIYSSTSIGYLVISGLQDSTYNIGIGFPKSHAREQTYSVSILRKDQGFLLRRNSGQEWVLYNWQNSQSITPVQDTRNTNALYGDVKKTDDFSSLMSAVVNDSAVLYIASVKVEEPKKEEKKPVITDSPDVKKEQVAKEDIKPPVTKKEEIVASETKPPVSADTALKRINTKKGTRPGKKPETVTFGPVVPETAKTDPPKSGSPKPELQKPESPKPEASKTETQASGITKLTELSGKNEKWLVYIDASGEKPDTISIHIAIEEESAKPEPPKATTNTQKPDTSSVTTGKQVVTDTPVSKETAKAIMPKEEPKKVDTAVKKPDAVVTKPVVTEKKLSMINSDCQGLAKESDIDKLRVKMLAETDLKNRIAAAQKVYKTMCLSASQIRALSELFTTDESRYKFFEASWPFAYDTDNFKLLIDLLTEETYVAKFKALVRL